ncbi:MAG: hypothetical protein AAF250_00610 [Pseudomonadota bacterium]
MAQDDRKVMVQFHFDGDPPDAKAVAARFDIDEAAIDPDFGVIVTDEVEKLCTVLVPEDVAAKMSPQLDRNDEAEGSFSSPRIAPFGPPSEDGE